MSARRVRLITCHPIVNKVLANRLPYRQAGIRLFLLEASEKPRLLRRTGISGSIRPRQAENVFGQIRQDQVGRDRRGLVKSRFSELALDVELLGEAEATVGLQAH